MLCTILFIVSIACIHVKDFLINRRVYHHFNTFEFRWSVVYQLYQTQNDIILIKYFLIRTIFFRQFQN